MDSEVSLNFPKTSNCEHHPVFPQAHHLRRWVTVMIGSEGAA